MFLNNQVPMLFILKIYKVIFLTKSGRWPPLQSCKRFWQQLSYTLLRRPSSTAASTSTSACLRSWIVMIRLWRIKQSEQTKNSTNASTFKVKLQSTRTEPNSLIKPVFIILKFGLSAAISRQFFFSISESVVRCGGFEMYSQCDHIPFVSQVIV